MLETFQAKYRTPFAVLGIRTSGARVTDIEYLPAGVALLAPLDAVAERACREIRRYLDDPEYRFELPFEYSGTPFQCRVWRAISSIPLGSTRSYAEIARALQTAPRPVGGACGANRLPLIIPCHRVLAANAIGGFMRSEGEQSLAIKRWLLRHEGVVIERELRRAKALPPASTEVRLPVHASARARRR
jgi:methylated-DNA-[protein]-cysteine S-methyltransferase